LTPESLEYVVMDLDWRPVTLARPARAHSIILDFIDRMNAGDAEGLIQLASPNLPVFENGRRRKTASWREHFRLYRIEILQLEAVRSVAYIIGFAWGTSRTGTPWKSPAAWYVRVHRGKVAEWRICSEVFK